MDVTSAGQSEQSRDFNTTPQKLGSAQTAPDTTASSYLKLEVTPTATATSAAAKLTAPSLGTFKGLTPCSRRHNEQNSTSKAASLESVASSSSGGDRSSPEVSSPDTSIKPAPNWRHQLVGTRVISPPSLKPGADQLISTSQPEATGSQSQVGSPLKNELHSKARYLSCTQQPSNNPNRSSPSHVKEKQPPTPSPRPRSTNLTPPFMCAGIVASIASSFFFSVNILCIKILPGGEEYGFEEKNKCAFFRGITLMLFCAISSFFQGNNLWIPRGEIWVNIMRAILGTVGTLGMYCSLIYIGMGDSSALVFSAPIWTSFLSYFILGEPLRWINFLALPCCILGIILIAHPGLILNLDHSSIKISGLHHLDALTTPPTGLNFSLVSRAEIDNTTESPLLPASDMEFPPSEMEQRLKGITIALATSICVAFAYIVLKFRKQTLIQTTTFWLGVCMAGTSGVLMITVGTGAATYGPKEYLLLLGNGVSSWIAQSLLQWAFLYEEAGVLSIVRTLDIALSFILSALFLEDEIYWTSIVGANIIGFIVVAFMLNSWYLKRRSSTHIKPTRACDVIQVTSLSNKQLEAAAAFGTLEKSKSSELGNHMNQSMSRPDVYRIDKIA